MDSTRPVIRVWIFDKTDYMAVAESDMVHFISDSIEFGDMLDVCTASIALF